MSAAVDELLWDARFPLLRLTGRGTRQFLHGQTSAAIEQAPEQSLIHTCWLTATGRVRALLEVRLDGEGADVLVLCGDADAVLEGFDRVIFPADRVKVKTTEPQRRVQRLHPAPQPLQWQDDVVWPTSNPLPDPWAALPVADPEQLEQWRISHGLPLSSQELNGETNPLELGLADWVSLEKGCYLGQETVAKLVSRDGVKQKLRCWTIPQQDGNTPLPQAGDTLHVAGERAGVITSRQKNGECLQGLALVRRGYLDHPTLTWGPDETEVKVHQPPAYRDCS